MLGVTEFSFGVLEVTEGPPNFADAMFSSPSAALLVYLIGVPLSMSWLAVPSFAFELRKNGF